MRSRPNLQMWVCGCVGVWVCGCVGVWVCGCVGVWVCGCVGVWVCGCERLTSKPAYLLAGQIPTQFGRLINMTNIDLWLNRLTGKLGSLGSLGGLALRMLHCVFSKHGITVWLAGRPHPARVVPAYQDD